MGYATPEFFAALRGLPVSRQRAVLETRLGMCEQSKQQSSTSLDPTPSSAKPTPSPTDTLT